MANLLAATKGKPKVIKARFFISAFIKREGIREKATTMLINNSVKKPGRVEKKFSFKLLETEEEETS